VWPGAAHRTTRCLLAACRQSLTAAAARCASESAGTAAAAMSLHVGILPSEPDSDTVAMKKKRMQQHYAQQLEVQMQEQRRQKQADKGQTKSEPTRPGSGLSVRGCATMNDGHKTDSNGPAITVSLRVCPCVFQRIA